MRLPSAASCGATPMVTLITYRDGIPVGMQPVTITTTGTYVVAAYIPLPDSAE